MTHRPKDSENGMGLLACGRSGLWAVDIDESRDRDDEWFAELEGPSTYLVFQLSQLDVVSKTIAFLCDHLQRPTPQRDWTAERDALVLGRFGERPVELRWDHESPRCFLWIESKAGTTLQLTFDKQDVEMLVEALRQVEEQIREG